MQRYKELTYNNNNNQEASCKNKNSSQDTGFRLACFPCLSESSLRASERVLPENRLLLPPSYMPKQNIQKTVYFESTRPASYSRYFLLRRAFLNSAFFILGSQKICQILLHPESEIFKWEPTSQSASQWVSPSNKNLVDRKVCLLSCVRMALENISEEKARLRFARVIELASDADFCAHVAVCFMFC